MKEAIVQLGPFISKGLSLNNNKRNNPMLVTSTGAMIYEGSLTSVQDLTAYQIDLSTYAPIVWPYPQLFPLADVVVICLKNRILELEGSTLTSKVSGLTVGYPWSLVDFHSYIYLTNGVVSVTKDPKTFKYSISTLPAAMACCDYNGQVLLGGTPII